MRTVEIRSFDNYFSANIILTRLQDAGIQCYLKDEHSATIYPGLVNAIGGIKLTVAADHAEEANKLLDHFHEEHMKAAICPRCGKNNFIEVAVKTPKSFLTSVLTRLFSNYNISSESIYQCGSCGYESKTLPENRIEHN